MNSRCHSVQICPHTPCLGHSAHLLQQYKLVKKQTSEGGGLYQPPPPSSSPTPPPQSGEFTCRWREMDCHGLKHSSPQQLESSRAQPSPAQAGHLGKDAESPLAPHGKPAHGVPTPPSTRRGSCKPWLNSPVRSQARFLMHWCSGIR